jgi:hypothetical protein
LSGEYEEEEDEEDINRLVQSLWHSYVHHCLRLQLSLLIACRTRFALLTKQTLLAENPLERVKSNLSMQFNSTHPVNVSIK